MSDDPFGEPSDNERTIIKPRPGGGGRPASRPAAPPPAAAAPAAIPTIGANPLAAAAAPVLAAAIRIAGARGRGPDIEQLRRGMVDAIRGFEKTALATGLDTKSLRAARYALCATIDDIVLSTPWGASSNWTQQTLTGIFHNEVIGGDRFFEILDQMSRELGRHSEVVELMYLCTSLGFEGRYRVMPRGVAALTELREGIYRAIRTRRGEFERELSPHWRGTGAAHRPLGQRVPFWAIALGAAAMLCLFYMGFNYALAGKSDIAYAELSGLPPTGKPAVARTTAVAAVPPPPAVVTQGGAASKLHQFLAPEIAQGLVVVFEDAQSVTVRLKNKSMFAAGEAQLNGTYTSLLERIGQALEDEKGHVIVTGYTDSQKIHTIRFPSNFQLSQARADAVAAIILTKLSDKSRLKAEGRGEADPIDTNATPEGRTQNRRTEVVLVRGGES